MLVDRLLAMVFSLSPTVVSEGDGLSDGDEDSSSHTEVTSSSSRFIENLLEVFFSFN